MGEGAQNSGNAASLVLLRRSQHVLFAVLVTVAAARTATVAARPGVALAGATGLAVWYGVGIALGRRRHRSRLLAVAWLLVLTAGWALLATVSADWVWVAFALFLLYLQMLPPAVAVPAVAALTFVAMAVFARHRHGWDVGAVLGPLIGAAVAVVMTLVYRALSQENQARARLVEQLTAAQQRLAETERAAGALAERERLAREIHDSVAQGLSSIVLLLRAAQAGTAPASSAAALATALDTARTSLDEARRLVWALTPAALHGRPLADALRRLVDDTGQLGIAVAFTVDGDPYPLPTATEVALLRVGQQALANVRTHAGASRSQVTLTYQLDAVRLDVADDGCGFDPGAPPEASTAGTGTGLAAMRARMAEVGGVLVIESAPGEGTALSATVPGPKGQP